MSTVLKNIHDPFETRILYEQLDELAKQFGSGMDYGFKEITPIYKPETGCFTIDLVCRHGAVASERFKWNPKTQTSLWCGVSIDGNDFFIPQNMIDEFPHAVLSI